MTTLKPDAFEEIFLKLEEESERRAMQAEEAAPSSSIPDVAVAARRTARRKPRHRGSVSISRFGHIEDATQQTTPSSPQPSTASVRGLTTFAQLYGAQSDNHSADSLTSMSSSFGDDAARSAESEHVTQVHRIAGRQSLPRSVGGILQRTFPRSRSKTGLSSGGVDTNVVIGVVVEEDHVEEPDSRETPSRPASRAMAYVQAPCTLTPQSSRLTISGVGTTASGGSWKSKAGELFKRKARPRSSPLWAMTTAQQS
ncbi:hypothetical protein BJV78DRAFT_1152182 [Lactifluus subvellereus]|nr:hypothetical protein BJV78DRAFT_1152182 [Lactifluus subvellereus]